MKNGPLVKELLRQGYLRSPRVREAFGHIDRADFVPVESAGEAYLNVPLALGHDQMLSQPLVVAMMLELLEPNAGEKILEVGAGSGWQAALLAYAVGDGSHAPQRGRVIAMENVEPLAELATKNLERYHFISEGVATVVHGDATGGWEAEAPFDKIISSVAVERIPAAWKSQVRIGGRIVVPVRESIVVFEKKGPASFTRRQYFGYDLTPIVGEA